MQLPDPHRRESRPPQGRHCPGGQHLDTGPQTHTGTMHTVEVTILYTCTCILLGLEDCVWSVDSFTPSPPPPYLPPLPPPPLPSPHSPLPPHSQVFGIPLSEQKITTGGIPIIIHKCLQFVEMFGLDEEGIYGVSGNIYKIRKLILAFNQDARGVMIDTEDFTVHDVAGALKEFFKRLPDPLLTHHLYPMFIEIMRKTCSFSVFIA